MNNQTQKIDEEANEKTNKRASERSSERANDRRNEKKNERDYKYISMISNWPRKVWWERVYYVDVRVRWGHAVECGKDITSPCNWHLWSIPTALLDSSG